jgi:hypothetical protein
MSTDLLLEPLGLIVLALVFGVVPIIALIKTRNVYAQIGRVESSTPASPFSSLDESELTVRLAKNSAHGLEGDELSPLIRRAR